MLFTCQVITKKENAAIKRRERQRWRHALRLDLTQPPVVPILDMVMEGAEEGINSKTAIELNARVHAVMEDIAEVIQGENNESPIST